MNISGVDSGKRRKKEEKKLGPLKSSISRSIRKRSRRTQSWRRRRNRAGL